MKILALDSSGLTASAALVEDDNLIAEYNVCYKKTHSQTLLPMLDEIRKMTELDLSTLDAVAIASGPGSFTGLRIGSATAKGLAQALNVPIVEIPTLLGLACNAYGFGEDVLVVPIMDARRNQVYTGIYRNLQKAAEEGKSGNLYQYEWETLLDQCPMGIDELTEILNKKEGIPDEAGSVLFLGDGVPVFSEYIDEHLLMKHTYAPAHMNRQRASAFAYLAIGYIKEGKTVSFFDHKPEYLRLSQAEREKNEGIRQRGAAY